MSEQEQAAYPPASTEAPAAPVSSRPPIDHPDYEFPKEVHNLLVTAQQGHVALSAMADSKASILMGATFVVFTLTIGEIMEHKATASLLLLAGFSFAATIFSVLAVRPNPMKPPAEYRPGLNLLFFGSSRACRKRNISTGSSASCDRRKRPTAPWRATCSRTASSCTSTNIAT